MKNFDNCCNGHLLLKLLDGSSLHPVNAFNWTKRAKRKEIEVVGLPKKLDIPKVPTINTRVGSGNKAKEQSKSKNSVQKTAIGTIICI